MRLQDALETEATRGHHGGWVQDPAECCLLVSTGCLYQGGWRRRKKWFGERRQGQSLTSPIPGCTLLAQSTKHIVATGLQTAGKNTRCRSVKGAAAQGPLWGTGGQAFSKLYFEPAVNRAVSAMGITAAGFAGRSPRDKTNPMVSLHGPQSFSLNSEI